MKKIKDLFDYMYYRIYKFYYKWDKETGITALIAVGMFQSTTVGVIFILILKILFSKSEIVPYSKSIAWCWAILFLSLTFLGQMYFNGKYENFNSIWGKEDSKIKKRRGWMIVLLLLLPWVVIIYLGILNRN